MYLLVIFALIFIFFICITYLNIFTTKEKYDPNEIISTDPNSMFYNWTLQDYINILEPESVFDMDINLNSMLGVKKTIEINIQEFDNINILTEYNLEYNLTTNQNQYRTRVIDSTVYEQGRCNCCYAFVLTTALDCAYSLYYNNSKNTILNTHFSAQQLLDCFSSPNGETPGKPAKGCKPSDYNKIVTQAYDVTNKLVLDVDYSYIPSVRAGTFNFEEASQRCESLKTRINTQTNPILFFSVNPIQMYRFVFDGIDAAEYITYIKKLIYKYGCILFGYHNAGYRSFYNYQNKIVPTIYTLDASSGFIFEKNFTHAMLLVGWTLIDNTNCWIVKNTWKKTWGCNGYAYFNHSENIFNRNMVYVIKPERPDCAEDDPDIKLFFKNVPEINIKDQKLVWKLNLQFKIYRPSPSNTIKFFINNMYINDSDNCIYYREKLQNSYNIQVGGYDITTIDKYYYGKDNTKTTPNQGYYFKGNIVLTDQIDYNNANDIKGIWNIVLSVTDTTNPDLNLSATLYLDWSTVTPENR